jgi:hypothetical protein
MRMYFIDESGTPEMGGTKFMVLGGVIIRCEDWPSVRRKVAELKGRYGINENVEIKWRHIRHPGGHLNPLHALSDTERVRYGKDMLSIVRGTVSARVVAIVLDKVAAYARPDLTSEEQIYERAVSLAMERYQYYLRATRDIGIIVQDQRRPHQDIRLRAFYQSLLTVGTRWTRFPNIIEGVFLTPSDYSTGLQIADFVVGSVYAAYGSDKPDVKFFNVVRGKITGDRLIGKRHGFKRWP